MQSPWRNNFPSIQHTNCIYLDSASSCQVPSAVIDAVSHYLSSGHGNAHRGMYPFSEKANDIYHQCRQQIANFIESDEKHVIFCKSTTEAINQVATSIQHELKPEDSIIITELEHHANILPWQRICQLTGATLHVLPVTEEGTIDDSQLEVLLQQNCKLFAFSHSSNVLAAEQPVQHFIEKAKKAGVRTLVDGAQAIAHLPVNVKNMGCDYYVFSAHKLYSTTGCGILYAADPDSLSPLLLGGGIVNSVTTRDHQLISSIERFEAGSPDIVAIVALSAALNFIDECGHQEILDWENQLTSYFLSSIESISDIQLLPRPSPDLPVISLTSKALHSHDMATLLGMNNIAVRAGHHCAQPLLNALGLKHCIRASFGMYNNFSDIDRFVEQWQDALTLA